MDRLRILDAVERVLVPRVAQPKVRSTRERLEAKFQGGQEALSPRMLRRALTELQAIADTSVGEIEGGRRANTLADWYAQASLPERRDCWLLMSEQFAPDPDNLGEAPVRYVSARGTDEEGQAEITLRKALRSPRTRLLQRFAIFPEGIAFLVGLRAELLLHLDEDKRFLALEAELESLFSTWFDVAFLELRRLTWDSPASLIEKLIRYEAVHDICSWADAKNRLDGDRRCYAFFHPSLVNEPLIFIEVALLDRIAGAIEPLLETEVASSGSRALSTAVFYSISNTHAGLRGVGFGDSLIKRVVETLRAEFPKLETFATLSPLPGFRRWFVGGAAQLLDELDPKVSAELARELGSQVTVEKLMIALEHPQSLQHKSTVRAITLRYAARYLALGMSQGRPLDSVARFHLGNGARVERINWAADLSPKGLRQSFGIMVNYLYDLKRIEKYRAMLDAGKVPVSGQIAGLVGKRMPLDSPPLLRLGSTGLGK